MRIHPPDAPARAILLGALLGATPLAPALLGGGGAWRDDLAARLVGFVAADVAALCRAAAAAAAARCARASPAGGAGGGGEAAPALCAGDFEAALLVVRPSLLRGVTVVPREQAWDSVGGNAAVKLRLQQVGSCWLPSPALPRH